jgi:hypothetical protein
MTGKAMTACSALLRSTGKAAERQPAHSRDGYRVNLQIKGDKGGNVSPLSPFRFHLTGMFHAAPYWIRRNAGHFIPNFSIFL